MNSSLEEASKKNNHFHSIHSYFNPRKQNNNYSELDSSEVSESAKSLRLLKPKKKRQLKAIPLMFTILVAFNLLSLYNERKILEGETKIIEKINTQITLLSGLTFRVTDLFAQYSTSYSKLTTSLNEKIAKEARKIVYRRPLSKAISSNKQKRSITFKHQNTTAAFTKLKTEVSSNEIKRVNSISSAAATSSVKLNSALEAEKEQTNKFLQLNLFENVKNSSSSNPMPPMHKVSNESDENNFQLTRATYKNRKSN